MNKADREFLLQRLEQISEGLKEAIRREVRRLRELGLPSHIARDGKVIALPPDEPLPDSSAE